MIKIIKEGTRKTHFCETCGCYFSYDKEDIIVNMDSISPNNDFRGLVSKKSINCPQCKTEIILEDNE